jgi:hypothetical protein
VPAAVRRLPYFLESFLELMGDWQSCRVWRHLGSWPDKTSPDRISDDVEVCILDALGLPLGTANIVEFSRSEQDKLLTLLFTTTIFGWSVYEDLYVVPDHGRYLLQTDHHNVIHVIFRSEADVNRWVEEMERRGFALPDEVPDPTFKQPKWMKD